MMQSPCKGPRIADAAAAEEAGIASGVLRRCIPEWGVPEAGWTARLRRDSDRGSVELDIFLALPLGDVDVEAGEFGALHGGEDGDELLAQEVDHRRVGL